MNDHIAFLRSYIHHLSEKATATEIVASYHCAKTGTLSIKTSSPLLGYDSSEPDPFEAEDSDTDDVFWE